MGRRRLRCRPFSPLCPAQRPHTRYRAASWLHNADEGVKVSSTRNASARIPQKGKLDRTKSPANWSRHIRPLPIGSNGRAGMARANRGEVLMQLSNEGILVILFVGLVAGWLAGKIVRGTGFGIIGEILVGIRGRPCPRYS